MTAIDDIYAKLREKFHGSRVPSADASLALAMSEDGKLQTSGGPSALVTESYDEIQVTYPEDDTEVYTYKKADEDVAVVTVTYTDSTKEDITSVVRS